MKIYSLDTTDFSNNGYGFLTDVISAEVEEEINGQYVLNMEYLIGGHLAEYLTRENIIVCKVSDGTEQPFRIKYIDQNFKTISIIAYHISYDLADDLVINIAPTNLQAQAFGRWILNNATTHSGLYTFNSNITSIASARYIRKNVLECFMSNDDNSMISKFGGEFKRDNYTITFNNKIGADNGVRLLIGKNINEIKITTDDTELYTRIVPVGYDGLTLPEIYVDSILINNYPHPKACVIKFEDIRYDPSGETEGAYTDINDFYDALRAAANSKFDEGLDKPIINVNIDWIDLSKTNEYKDYEDLETISLGDTLTCDMGDFNYTTRVIYTKYDVLLDRITGFQIGKPIANYATQTNATIEKVDDVDAGSLLEQAQENATALLKNAMTGYIYFDYENGDFYIMDNPDPEEAEKVWRWNLNGLGYSSTGINGTYGLAITMDGSIVADYITTGTLNTSVINGYDSLVAQVEDMEDLLEEAEGTNSIIIENASKNTPYYIRIYPTSTNVSFLYPHNNLYPSNNLFMTNRTLRFTNANTHETFDYELPCDLLYYDSTHYDMLTIDGKSMTCIKTKMVDYTSSGTTEIVPTESIEYPFPIVELTEGDYTISFLNYTDVYMQVKLIRKNELTTMFASSVYTNSKITQTRDELLLEVNEKVDENEIIAKINLGIEEGQGVINLTGNTVTIDSDNFQLDNEGNVNCNDAVMDDAQINNATIIGGSLNLISTGSGASVITIGDNSGDYDLEIDSQYINIEDRGITSKYGREINIKNEGTTVFDLVHVNTPDNQAMQPFITITRTDGASTTIINPSTIETGGNITANKMYAYEFVNRSSEKSKENIKKADKGLDILKDIDIYTYDYKDESTKKKNSKKKYGIVIGDKYNYAKEITNDDNSGVNLYSFISVCCQSIKEQQEEIEELRNEIKKLKKEGKYE